MEKQRTTGRSARTMELRQAGSSSRDKELLQGGAAERLCPARERLCCGCVCSFVFTPTSHLPTSQQGPIPVLRSTDVAAAALQQRRFLPYQLCARGALRGGSETGTQFLTRRSLTCYNNRNKKAKCCGIKIQTEINPELPHTPVKCGYLSLGKCMVNVGSCFFTI